MVVNMEKVEQGFALVVANIERLQKELNTDFYDAFVEQNVAFSQGRAAEADLTELSKNNQQLKALDLTKKEWQKLFQFVLLKGSQVAPLQPNHALTPDSIATIFQFIIETLENKEELNVLELGSGTGNLAEALLVHSMKKINYLGFEVDDLLLDLAASMAEIIGTQATFMQVDGTQVQTIDPVELVISDLPVGFYPDDEHAKEFTVYNPEGKTFAHHLLIEASFKYLQDQGFALFLAPEDLLTSTQAPLLKNWLQKQAYLTAVITLPEKLFKQDAKAIFLFEKTARVKATFVYPLTSLTDPEGLQKFRAAFKKHLSL